MVVTKKKKTVSVRDTSVQTDAKEDLCSAMLIVVDCQVIKRNACYTTFKMLTVFNQLFDVHIIQSLTGEATHSGK